MLRWNPFRSHSATEPTLSACCVGVDSGLDTVFTVEAILLLCHAVLSILVAATVMRMPGLLMILMVVFGAFAIRGVNKARISKRSGDLTAYIIWKMIYLAIHLTGKKLNIVLNVACSLFEPV